jgi:hypothetical protein
MALFWPAAVPALYAQAPARPGPAAPGQSGPVFQLNETTPSQSTLKTFEKSIKEFQTSLSGLAPSDKKEVRTIYESVRVFADQQQAAGKKVDRLLTFTGRICEYCNKQLGGIEKTDPDLLRRKPEHEVLNDVFYKGKALIESYDAYVHDKNAP